MVRARFVHSPPVLCKWWTHPTPGLPELLRVAFPLLKPQNVRGFNSVCMQDGGWRGPHD